MHIEGTLTKWNDDRGFGFITPSQGGPEVFVHISAFPKGYQRPKLGEQLTFEIEVAEDGKKKAKNILYPSRPVVRPIRQSDLRNRREKKSLVGQIIPLIVVGALVAYGYNRFNHHTPPETDVAAQTYEAVTLQSNKQETSISFQCDGRTHCSQMTSCAEATFFLRNCPNVQMDGNNDGVPCEQQWCG
ncbi:MAG: cold shock domain-containing protein [Sulfuricella sp.]|jgi:cold shock CspA family protein